MVKKKVIQTIGKRKRAVARMVAKPGTGKVTINGKPLEQYTPFVARLSIKEPMILAGPKANEFDFKVNVQGGGMFGQASAARQAIAKGLVQIDKSLKPKFDDYDGTLLVADVRRTEPHKPSRSSCGPRKRKQLSKR
ncbi:MAG: 30S ribosomal protein S9 [Candidatus Aenigmarchaeota archaeon]|nr:30S ribosomal protein S9 [Candidatus Aenigmarchaeota archaeon]